jgi:hypothetical protein
LKRVLVLLTALLAVACGEKHRDVLVLLDGSGSLGAAERESSLKILSGLLRHKVQEGDDYTVAEIDGELRSEPIATGRKLTRSDSEIWEFDQQADRVVVQAGARLAGLPPSSRERTCIAATLLESARHFATRGGTDSGVVFVISDMAEDCEAGGQRWNLCELHSRQFAKAAAAAAGSERALIGLSIIAILPYGGTGTRRCLRSLPELASFWREFAARTGARIRLQYPSDVPDLFSSSEPGG